jgi:hypothetical protein
MPGLPAWQIGFMPVAQLATLSWANQLAASYFLMVTFGGLCLKL